MMVTWRDTPAHLLYRSLPAVCARTGHRKYTTYAVAAGGHAVNLSMGVITSHREPIARALCCGR